MAKTGGFFLKGLAGGLQGLGTQIAEMTWQKKERERIQKEKDEIIEAASVFNKKIESYYADGTLSDDEKMQLHTAYMASAYNIQEVIEGSYKAVMEMDRDTVENNLAYLKSYRESWGNLDFDLSTIPEIAEYYKGQIIGEKGKQMFDAGDRLLKKQYEEKQKEVPKMDFNEKRFNWKIEQYNLGNITADQLFKSEGMYIEPSATKERLDLMTQYGATTEEKKNYLLYGTTGKAGGVTEGEEDIARTDISYWEGVFNNITSEEQYNRQYELLKKSKISEKYEPETYREILEKDVKAMVQEFKRLLTPDNKFRKALNKEGELVEDEEAKATYIKYLKIYEQKVRELISKYPDIDISQFPKFLSIEEIKPIGFWKGMFTGGGVAKGDYSVIDPKGW